MLNGGPFRDESAAEGGMHKCVNI